jgi:hypothetical protein
MWMTVLKALGTAAVVLVLGEIAKRWTVLAAAIAALPLMTMLVVANLALDASDKGGVPKANEFVAKFFYLFWPGLLFPVIIMVGQRFSVPFWWSYSLAVIATFAGTWGWIVMLKSMGVNLD